MGIFKSGRPEKYHPFEQSGKKPPVGQVPRCSCPDCGLENNFIIFENNLNWLSLRPIQSVKQKLRDSQSLTISPLLNIRCHKKTTPFILVYTIFAKMSSICFNRIKSMSKYISKAKSNLYEIPFRKTD